MIDAKFENDTTCIPWESSTLKIPTIRFDLNYDFEQACLDSNPDAGSCTIRACILELFFLENIIIEIQINSEFLENTLKHTSGFDHDSECGLTFAGTSPVTTESDNNNLIATTESPSFPTTEDLFDLTVSTPGFSITNHTIECCGEYPVRHGYKPDNGAHGCCGSATYSTYNHDCCDAENSILGAFGTCEIE